MMDNTRAGSYQEKLALLEKAVALDPEFAEAWALLTVECIYTWKILFYRNDSTLQARARYAYQKALELGPDLAHTAYARHALLKYDEDDYEAAIAYLL